jgi:phage terminase large subunit-like protein
MRDASDERAVRAGCWFDEERGQFAVDWMRDYLRLYEGESAGQPFECCKDWQYDAVMRLFGWVRGSEDWGRVIRRFRKASWWIAKKNKKSPTMAAITCFVAFGAGEMGQKCFPTAKDGVQIKENVVRHIHEMIRQSDELSAECKIYKNTGVVFHHPTRSLIMPLSSDNVASQKAKEGLNGSVFVDEVHVVDKQHMRRLSRAGISRPEPIHLEVSTAGDEPESYGKARFDYAQTVVDGRSSDIETLAIIYAAPQDISDADIHADPLRFGQMANPAMGHTVKKSEFLSDYESSKASLSEFADFKKYRLNIWQQSANPWISIHDWRQCPMSVGPLPVGHYTTAAFDLSQTTDFTAWVLFQPDEERPRCCGHYWITEKRAKTLAAEFEIPVDEWVRDGWVTISTDDKINYKQVQQRMAVDIKKYKIAMVGMDRAFSGDTLQFLTNEQGVEVVEIAQGAMSLSTPSKELEGLVIDHRLDSRQDPVMAWMIGNTSVKRDENDNIKPVKTVGGVRKHIDGVVSLVMAILVSLANKHVKRTGRVFAA